MAKGGTTKTERILATRVRNLSLNMIYKALSDERPENQKFRQDLILKLAPTVLPRKVEMGGEDGAPIKVMFDNTFNESSTTTPKTTGSN